MDTSDTPPDNLPDDEPGDWEAGSPPPGEIKPDRNPGDGPAQKLYQGIHALLRQLNAESDLSCFETIGALEAVKQDYLDSLGRYNDDGRPNG